MTDEIKEILNQIGLDKNTVMVSDENEVGKVTIFYPNHMQEISVLNTKNILDKLQKMMEEHAMDVASDIKMIRCYRSSLE
jgi:hypothetical protein